MTPIDTLPALSDLTRQSDVRDERPIEPTAHEQKLMDGIRSAFAQASSVPGLDLFLKTKQAVLQFLAQGHAVAVKAVAEPEAGSYESFLTSSAEPLELLIRCPETPLVQSLAKLAIKHANDLIEAGEREEVLMEEIAADWESLDALCEINTEVFTSTTLTEGTNRLIKRIASLKEGFQGALYLLNGSKLECVVATGCEAHTLEADDLGPVQRVMSERSTIVLNRIAAAVFGEESTLCWRKARSLAAVPMLTPDAIRGFIIVWSERAECEIDTSFQHLIDALSNRVSMLLECESLTNSARQKELLDQEMEIASTIQDTLLSGEAPNDVEGAQFAALTIPSKGIDGDFFDFYLQRDGAIDLIIGDVMGKGVAAALLGTAVKSQFTRSVLALANSVGEELVRPERIVQRVAANMNGRLMDVERFVTLCYARVGMKTRLLEFVDCGHTQTIVHRKLCGPSFVLQGESLPLGISAGDIPVQQAIEFLPGDTFLFYSDGVTENTSPEGELFGTDRLIECVEQWSSCGPQMLLDQLCRDSKLHCRKPFFSDDFTVVAVRIRLEQSDPVEVRTRDFRRDLEELAPLRDWLAEAAARVGEQGLSDDAFFRLQLICVEAFDNCVIHGSAEGSDTIRMEAAIFHNSIKVTLRHQAAAFDPFHAAKPSFDGSRDGGFGLFIMLRSADEFLYEREGDAVNVLSFSVLQPKEGKHFHATNHYTCQ